MPEQTNIVERANMIRENINEIEQMIRNYVHQIKATDEAEGFEKGECIAHAMIALRSTEDARMRIGKVIQYSSGGVSVFDKK
jgi:hypothetical protein|tara:strand:+ start:15350 stop:15595 length:246 start_codon:yes stop_codon:yes gene_type:complete